MLSSLCVLKHLYIRQYMQRISSKFSTDGIVLDTDESRIPYSLSILEPNEQKSRLPNCCHLTGLEIVA
jgi:hypothetical protein